MYRTNICFWFIIKFIKKKSIYSMNSYTQIFCRIIFTYYPSRTDGQWTQNVFFLHGIPCNFEAQKHCISCINAVSICTTGKSKTIYWKKNVCVYCWFDFIAHEEIKSYFPCLVANFFDLAINLSVIWTSNSNFKLFPDEKCIWFNLCHWKDLNSYFYFPCGQKLSYEKPFIFVKRMCVFFLLENNWWNALFHIIFSD